MNKKSKRTKRREEKKARKKAMRQEQINSMIETYNKMSVAEQVLSTIALAFIILSIILMGYFVMVILSWAVALILAVIAVTLYQGRQRRNNRLLKFIRIQQEIDLQSIKRLIGWSEKKSLSVYINIVSSGNKELFYDLETKKLHWVGQSTRPTSGSDEIPQGKIYCTYCGTENESDISYCISCGDPIT
jgi:hypothetical protein